MRSDQRVVFLVPFLAILASGCGMLDKFGRDSSYDGFTEVRIARGREGAINKATLMGGLMLYIEGVNGTLHSQSFQFNDELDPKTFSIPNGSYKVFAIGYTTTDFGSGGGIKCGYGDAGNVVVLSGGSRTIGVSVAAATCADASFSDPNYLSGSVPLALSFTSCSDAGYAAVTGGTDSCISTNQGNVMSVVVSLPEYVRNANGTQLLAPGVQGACQPITAGTAFTTFQIPVGSAGALPSLAVGVKAFSSSTCTAGTLLGTYSFPKGLLNANDAVLRDATGAIKLSTGGSKVYYDGTETRLYVRNIP